ncbi:ribbon-helix-helix protein, CopG family [Hellea sp.]|nr:ribbon-helix-helix protein, CopG family [Hellea sp.]
MATKPMGVRLSEDMIARLKVLGEKKDRSPHYLVKEAVEQFVERTEADMTELEILNARWERYELTGESIPHEDVVAYFKKKIRDRKSS